MTDDQIKQLGRTLRDDYLKTLERLGNLVGSDEIEEMVDQFKYAQRDIKKLHELALAKQPTARLLKAAKDVSDLHELIHQYASQDLARAIGAAGARKFIQVNVELDRALKEHDRTIKEHEQ